MWLLDPPHGAIPDEAWRSFLGTMTSWLIIWVAVWIFLSVGVYAIHAHSRKLRSGGDVFAPYAPLGWLALALFAVAVLLISYRDEFVRSFPDSPVSWVEGGLKLAMVGGIVTFITSYFLTWLPGVTPRRYRYRPRAWPFPGRYRRRPPATGS